MLDQIHVCVSHYQEWLLKIFSAWVVFLTVRGPLTHPCHTGPVTSWRERRWLQRLPIGTRLRRRSLCRPPAAQIHTPHSALLGTTSSPQHDTWDEIRQQWFLLRIGIITVKQWWTVTKYKEIRYWSTLLGNCKKHHIFKLIHFISNWITKNTDYNNSRKAHISQADNRLAPNIQYTTQFPKKLGRYV